jgi:hypothetical protein
VRKNTSTQLQTLRSLADQPAAQKEYAVTLLSERLGNEVILSALQALGQSPPATARPGLIALYQVYEQKGTRRDPAANLRAQILRVLRPLVQPEDVPLLLQAIETYVFPPPARLEEGAALRSAALNALAEVDETLSRYHAVRLLADKYTDPMSGEPALTAARLLAAYEESTVLYFYVMQELAQPVPEVLSEALRGLTRLPEACLPRVIERYEGSPHAVVLVGLFDLLLQHRSGPYGWDFIRTFLRSTQQVDAYQYLVTILLTQGREQGLTVLLEAIATEFDPARLTILELVLPLFATLPAIQAALQQVQERLARLPDRRTNLSSRSRNR